jgi:hypothetical protein
MVIFPFYYAFEHSFKKFTSMIVVVSENCKTRQDRTGPSPSKQRTVADRMANGMMLGYADKYIDEI